MNNVFSRRELPNKENLGQFANVKKFRDSTRAQPKENPLLPGPMSLEPTLSHAASLPLFLPPFNTTPIHPAHHPLPHANSYVDAILTHIRSREEVEPRPNPEYMANQRDINLRMRSILVDWLVDVNIKFRMLPQSLFMTVALIDRFLAAKEVSRQRLQLVGVTALMIIGKYEEIYPPLLKDYVAVCDNAYTKEEILAMESEILSALNFELNKTCSFVFLEYFRQKHPLDDRAFVFCRYLLENALLDVSYLRFNNHILAAGAIFLVNKIFKRDGWSLALEEATGVQELKAKSCAKELFAMISRTECSMLTAIKRKFSVSELFEVSKYKIEKVPTHSAA